MCVTLHTGERVVRVCVFCEHPECGVNTEHCVFEFVVYFISFFRIYSRFRFPAASKG